VHQHSISSQATSIEAKQFWRKVKAEASPNALAELNKQVDEKLAEAD